MEDEREISLKMPGSVRDALGVEFQHADWMELENLVVGWWFGLGRGVLTGRTNAPCLKRMGGKASFHLVNFVYSYTVYLQRMSERDACYCKFAR